LLRTFFQGFSGHLNSSDCWLTHVPAPFSPRLNPNFSMDPAAMRPRALVGSLRVVAAVVLALSPCLGVAGGSPSECEQLQDSGSSCAATAATSILQQQRVHRGGDRGGDSANVTEANAGGAEWTEDEALIVMAKLHHIFKSPSAANRELTRVHGDYECYTGFDDEGPQPCDGRNGNGSPPGKSVYPRPAKFVRLGFHDCMKYTDGTGGCDGCLHFYDQFRVYNDKDSGDKRNMDRPDAVSGTNNGLAMSADMLELIWTDKDWPPSTPSLPESLQASGKSRADLWAFAALVATDYAMAENNKACRSESTKCGHLYTAVNLSHGCTIQPRRWLRFRTGRRDCPTSDKPPSVNGRAKTMSFEPSTGHRWRPYETTKVEMGPNPSGNASMTRDFFRQVFQFSARHTVAIMGAHSLGQMHGGVALWKYKWQFKQTYFLNNNYYRLLVNKPSVYIGSCHPFRFSGGPNGALASTAWVVRPIRKTVSAGPYLWFHSYTRCPYCYRAADGTWVNEETEGDDDFRSTECCVCHEREASDVPDGCIANISKDETMTAVDMAMIQKFDVNEYGVPSGCPGFPSSWNRDNIVEQATEDDRGARYRRDRRSNGGEIDFYQTRPECPDNREYTARFVDQNGILINTMAGWVRYYADNQDAWANDFYEALEKMLNNGYAMGSLVDGPDVLGIERSTCPGNDRRTRKCVKQS